MLLVPGGDPVTGPEDVPQAAVDAAAEVCPGISGTGMIFLADAIRAARPHLPPTDEQRREIAAQVLRDAADQIGDLRAAMAAVRHTADRLEDQAAELRDLADALSVSVPVGDTQRHQPGSMDAPSAEVEGARGVVGEAQDSGESP